MDTILIPIRFNKKDVVAPASNLSVTIDNETGAATDVVEGRQELKKWIEVSKEFNFNGVTVTSAIQLDPEMLEVEPWISTSFVRLFLRNLVKELIKGGALVAVKKED